MNKIKSLKQLIKKTIESTYGLLSEVLDINNIYSFKRDKERSNLWTFTDRNNVNHFIIINKDFKIEEDRVFEIKFGWIKNGNPCYDKPQDYDDKIFNTHIHIALNEILPWYDKYGIVYTLRATEKYRYRLYKIALTKFLNHKKYKIEFEQDKNLMIISQNKKNKNIKVGII